MYPILYQHGEVAVRSYGLFLAISFLAGLLVAYARAPQYGVKRRTLANLSVLILVAALLGSRLLFVAEHPTVYLADPWRALRIWQGGLSLYGGAVVAAAVVFACCRAATMSFATVADLLAPALALGEALTRVGCFLNGCCFGTACHWSWGLVFPAQSAAGRVFPDTPIHPTQLYAAGASLLIFGVLLAVERSRGRPGRIIGLFLLLHGAMRLAMDALRYHAPSALTLSVGGVALTSSQLASAGLILLGSLTLLRISGRRDARAGLHSSSGRGDGKAMLGRRRPGGFAVAVLLLAPAAAHAVCGDLNDSGTLTATDARACLAGVVGIIDLAGTCEPASGCAQDDPACGDVNGSDTITSTDCLLILSASVFLVDLSSSCNCDEPDPCAGVVPVAGTAARTELAVDGIHEPVYVTAPPEDPRRLFVVQQAGTVRMLLDGALQAEPFLDISDRISSFSCCGEEGGLLGMAFHPDYASNGWVFVNYTDTAGDTVIARYQKMPGLDLLDATDEKRLFGIDQIDPYHNGGQLQFARDGTLWIGMGDGNGDPGGDQAGTAQNDQQLLGKMLRVDVDVAGPPYFAVPTDNPNPGPTLRALIWAKGLRNPWRFSFDRETGDLYIADVGQNRIEEIDYRPAASTGDENYGWNFYEGSECFAGSPCPSRSQFVFPIYEYGHSGAGPNGDSVTGGYVYRGCAMPDLHGVYFFADFVSGFVRSFVVAGGVATGHTDRTAALDPTGARSIDNPSSFGEDARGELYIADYADGEIYRIVP